ncbi:hypothetical protein RRG08_043507 [Elysia crispata]|uniref:Uncharacterized protein n=1 Tax=Elysia crispata TaxID=231223 RepID=A0AAE1CYD8_9GAST|nr:hypothetical protein RRG08_043507 [Elysia crispata]
MFTYTILEIEKGKGAAAREEIPVEIASQIFILGQARVRRLVVNKRRAARRAGSRAIVARLGPPVAPREHCRLQFSRGYAAKDTLAIPVANQAPIMADSRSSVIDRLNIVTAEAILLCF